MHNCSKHSHRLTEAQATLLGPLLLHRKHTSESFDSIASLFKKSESFLKSQISSQSESRVFRFDSNLSRVRVRVNKFSKIESESESRVKNFPKIWFESESRVILKTQFYSESESESFEFYQNRVKTESKIELTRVKRLFFAINYHIFVDFLNFFQICINESVF